ncbi:MAG: reverse transcriptase [Chloroflexi bacterium]|nr:reverse transcriptase [Chloroflexota bacterium]
MFKNHPLFTLENIYRAYRQCRRHKRGTVNAMKFEQNLEENLVALHEELTSGSYRPGRSIAFLIEKPKRREIFAADFRDRVVHHVLVGYLEPRWERRFIHDSYACRQGKGTHKGVERLRAFTRQATANGTRRAWYLQLDIRGFFNSIDRNILYQRLAAKESDPAVLWLVRTLVFNDPTENCLMRRVCRADFDSLPAHQTLFKAAPNCGLPIGNLTSQFFANVYLDALDQFVKHRLKARYYVRYCDDFVLLSEDRAILEKWEGEIREFLLNELRLTLNDRKRLRPVSDGIDFLGYIVRPNYLLVRRRVVGACYERLARAESALIEQGLTMDDGARRVYPWPWPVVEAVYQWLNSYLGHFRKAASYHLVERLRRRFPWLEEYFLWDGERVAYTFSRPRPGLRISQQRAQLCDRLPGHVLVVQMGKWWELWGGYPENLLPKGWPRFPENRLPTVKGTLWESGLPVAWIGETGRRITRISERLLVHRWPGASDQRPLSSLRCV